MGFLAGGGVPEEGSGGVSDLTGDTLVGLGVVFDGEDVVCVGIVVGGDIFGFVVDETSTKELLAVGGGVVDYAEGSTLPDIVAIGGKVKVVPCIICFVTVHEVYLVLLLWLILIYLIV